MLKSGLCVSQLNIVSVRSNFLTQISCGIRSGLRIAIKYRATTKNFPAIRGRKFRAEQRRNCNKLALGQEILLQ